MVTRRGARPGNVQQKERVLMDPAGRALLPSCGAVHMVLPPRQERRIRKVGAEPPRPASWQPPAQRSGASEASSLMVARGSRSDSGHPEVAAALGPPESVSSMEANSSCSGSTVATLASNFVHAEEPLQQRAGDSTAEEWVGSSEIASAMVADSPLSLVASSSSVPLCAEGATATCCSCESHCEELQCRSGGEFPPQQRARCAEPEPLAVSSPVGGHSCGSATTLAMSVSSYAGQLEDPLVFTPKPSDGIVLRSEMFELLLDGADQRSAAYRYADEARELQWVLSLSLSGQDGGAV